MNSINDRYGYYIYNNKPYYIRQQILHEMLLNKDYDGKITFYYHDEEFSKFNWTVEIPTNISLLYKYRAQQLRDSYKYIILAFSGGSDSTQMLMTFLKNKIFIDEIQIYNHEKLISKIDKNTILNDKDLNQFLEYELAVVPILKKYKELIPNTKISIIDNSDFLFDQIKNNKFEMSGNNSKNIISSCFVVPKMLRSFSYNYINYNLNNLKKDNSCFIRGVDKPNLMIKDNILYFSFYDIAYQASNNFNSKKLSEFMTIENFYWSKNMPLIPIKQSQMIKKMLETNKIFYDKFTSLRNRISNDWKNKIRGFSVTGELEKMYNDIIYPDWLLTIFSGDKPRQINPEFKLYEKIVGNHNGEYFMDEFRSHEYKKYEKITNKSYIDGFIPSKIYHLGPLNLKWST